MTYISNFEGFLQESHASNTFYYVVDMDERGEYGLTIYDSRDREVYTINTEMAHEMIEDGFLKYKPHEDDQRLQQYLVQLGILPRNSRLISAEEFEK
jgi:hypothetical protein